MFDVREIHVREMLHSKIKIYYFKSSVFLKISEVGSKELDLYKNMEVTTHLKTTINIDE